jgi:hypothetical protein
MNNGVGLYFAREFNAQYQKLKKNINCKVILSAPGKHTGDEVQVHPFLTSVLDGCELPNSRSGRFIHQTAH